MGGYQVSRTVPYDRDTMFDLVAEVERYPDFVPWYRRARVRNRSAGGYVTDQVIAFDPIRQAFTSQTTLHRPHTIEIRATSGPFRRFLFQWAFHPSCENGCDISVTVDIDFASAVLRKMAGTVSRSFANKCIEVFEREAAKRACAPAAAVA